MEKWEATALVALAVFLACLFQLYPLNPTQFGCLGSYDSTVDSLIGHSLWAFTPHFFLGTSKKFGSYRRFSSKRNAKSKGKVGIFTGVEAKTDHAIFEILDAYGPLCIRELLKCLNRYGLDFPYFSSLNKRINALERGGYIGQVAASVKSRAAFYELRPKFYLARFLNSNSPDDILSKLAETDAEIILADLVSQRANPLKSLT